MAVTKRRDIVFVQRNLAAFSSIQVSMQPGYHNGTVAQGGLRRGERVSAWVSRTIVVTYVCLGFSGQVCAGERFPGYEPDRKALDTQQKVDQLFDRGAYERAIVIYRDELAPLGDKYAQYMVGYMYLTGKGVDEDPVVALAWYRLSAERGHDSFVAVYDQLSGALSVEQRQLAGDAYAGLAATLGDAAIVKRLVEKDIGRLQRGGAPDVSLSLQAGGNERINKTMARQIRLRLESRMRFLENLAATRRPDDAAFRKEIAELGVEVAAAIERVETSSD